MKHCLLTGALALALVGLPASFAAPSDADSPLALTLSGTGPTYVLEIDAQARALSASSSLADLRVRNAVGETMPFAWVETSLPPAPPQKAAARLYKVPLPPSEAGSATTDKAPPRQAWIVDTGEANQDLLRLDLALPQGTQGVYTLRIEAGDDLQHWRTLRDDAQLVQLQPLLEGGATGAPEPPAAREVLSANGIDLDNVPARYLRLTTAPRSAIQPLVSAVVTRASHQSPPPPLDWSAPIVAARCDATSCDYALPRNTPVAALQVVPGEVDTIGQVTVLAQVDPVQAPPQRPLLLHRPLHALRLRAERSATPAGAGWTSAAVANVYWLSQASGAPDLHSPPLRLDGDAWKTLRLETLGPIGQLGRVAPMIHIAVRRRQLAFVARGDAPFVLARATASEKSAPMSLSELMPGRAPDAALPAASASVAAHAMSASSPSAAAPIAPSPSHTPWLWAALLVGLAAMAAMAGSLLRQPAAAAEAGSGRR